MRMIGQVGTDHHDGGIEIKWPGYAQDERGIDARNGDERVRVTPGFYRPAEVDLLIGNASLAHQKLEWAPKTTLEELCQSSIGLMCSAQKACWKRYHKPPSRRLLLSDVHSEAVNVCSGKSVALLEVLDLMEKISGYRPHIEVDPVLVRKDEVKNLCGNPSRLFKKICAIEPTPLRTILQLIFNSLAVSAKAASMHERG